MSLHPVDAVILERLYDRPSWLRSLQPARSRVRMLIDAGYARRIAPPLSKCKNLVELTPAGRLAIENHWKNKP